MTASSSIECEKRLSTGELWPFFSAGGNKSEMSIIGSSTFKLGSASVCGIRFSGLKSGCFLSSYHCSTSNSKVVLRSKGYGSSTTSSSISIEDTLRDSAIVDCSCTFGKFRFFFRYLTSVGTSRQLMCLFVFDAWLLSSGISTTFRLELSNGTLGSWILSIP